MLLNKQKAATLIIKKYIMKKSLIALIMLNVSCLAYSQNDSSMHIDDKNSIGFSPFALAFGKLQVNYERGINKNMSLGLSVGAKFSSGVFKVSGLDNSKIATDDFNLKGIELLPEYRWYVQKDVKRSYTGFFVGAYYRLRSYKDEIQGIYYSSDVLNPEQKINMETKIQSHAVGLEVGYKLPIRDHLYIDFLIAGPGIGSNKVSLQNKGSELAEDFYKDLSSSLKEKYDFLNGITSDINFNKKSGTERKANITLPTFYYGIKVGYSF
jgi:hypothetical protein